MPHRGGALRAAPEGLAEHRAPARAPNVRHASSLQAVIIDNVHAQGAQESTNHLRYPVHQHLRPGEPTLDSRRQGHGGVNVGARNAAGHIHSNGYGQTPSPGDGVPVVAGSGQARRQTNISHYAVAKKNKDKRADEFGNKLTP